ncbi:MAG: hypothetical protein ACREE0_04965 [Phenylobacterium sp.]
MRAGFVRISLVRATIQFTEDGYDSAPDGPYYRRVDKVREYLLGPFAEDLAGFLGVPFHVDSVVARPGSLIVAFLLMAKVAPEIAHGLATSPEWLNDLDRLVGDLLGQALEDEDILTLSVTSTGATPILDRGRVPPASSGGSGRRGMLLATFTVVFVLVILAFAALFSGVRETSAAQAKMEARAETIEKDVVRLTTLVEVMRSMSYATTAPGERAQAPTADGPNSTAHR